VDAGTTRFDGSVGIGTSAPSRALEVVDGTGNPQVRLSYTSGSVYSEIQTTSTGNLELRPAVSGAGDRVVVYPGAGAANARIHFTGMGTGYGTKEIDFLLPSTSKKRL
jgi:hypothetical protein